MVASVGSFFMSERVLKPKASVLTIMAMILAYDLTTKTHDVSSLRVYRGPAMVALTLMMAAYSLRTWRRNGVACDELLFLPGTAHGVTHGVDSPPPSVRGNTTTNNNNPTANTTTNNAASGESGLLPIPNTVVASQSSSNNTKMAANHSHSEGDIAAGGTHPDALELRKRTRSFEATDPLEGGGIPTAAVNTPSTASSNNKRGVSVEEMRQHGVANKQQQQHVLGDVELVATKSSQNRLRTNSCDSSLGWGSEEEDDLLQQETPGHQQNELGKSPQSPNADDEERRGFLSGPANLLCRNNQQTAAGEDGQGSSDANNGDPNNNQHGLVDNFRENHPQITRFGSYFFFRATTSSTQNAAYAPSGPAVVGAALDLGMPVIFNFHLFIEAYNHIKPKDADSETPAKILPVIFLSVLIVRSLVPPGRRGRFWSTLKFTVMSPFHRVKFRDAFVGDVMTSMVRPGQDILFALSYYVTVIWGTLTGHYGLSESGQILEGSWILHNVILPSCALLPLWWRFLQTLRQAYDEEKRWPHLGNAFKYLTATLVILYGMTHPENRRSPWWIVAFIASVLYQIWWDVFVDWQLLEIPPQSFSSTLDSLSPENWLTNITSRLPDSHILLNLQMYVFTPLAEGIRRLNARICSLQYIKLRSRRLYKNKSFYWRIFAFNALMRFTWMLCFIPAYRLSSSGEEKVTTFSSDVNSYVGVVLPVAEIIRRCFWGILFLERKTIEMTEDDGAYARLNSSMGDSYDDANLEDIHDKNTDDDQLSGGDHSQTAKHGYQVYLPTWLNAQQQIQHDTSSSSTWSITSNEKVRSISAFFENREDLMHNLFLVELSLWAVAFVGTGCWAAS